MMFKCGSEKGCKSDSKVECMASWLILGGFIPWALSAVTKHSASVTIGNFSISDHHAYLWVIAVGVASLCVKRASRLWQFIVALGMYGFLAMLVISFLNFSNSEIPSIVWALACIILISKQYHYDVKNKNKKSDMGIAIVTGASSGIGLSTAKLLKQEGYRVFGTSRKATGDDVNGITMLPCDVTDGTSVEKMVNEVLSQTGRIDLLVNNAGISLVAAAEDSSTEQAQDLFNVNVFGVMRVANAVLPIMRKQGSGRIVNISSVVGILPAPFHTLYASTKHAVEGYSESLDHEVRTFGIRSVLVEPAFTRTSIDQNPMKADKPISAYDEMRANTESLLIQGIAKGDAPEIVANTILRAATEDFPKLRYTAGKSAGFLRFVRRFFPESFVDKSLRKFNNLPIIKTKSCCC
jgi:NAD(P)-dependent dehydrogenase (short-subunit alcohol dehydrogenase family)